MRKGILSDASARRNAPHLFPISSARLHSLLYEKPDDDDLKKRKRGIRMAKFPHLQHADELAIGNPNHEQDAFERNLVEANYEPSLKYEGRVRHFASKYPSFISNGMLPEVASFLHLIDADPTERQYKLIGRTAKVTLPNPSRVRDTTLNAVYERAVKYERKHGGDIDKLRDAYETTLEESMAQVPPEFPDELGF